MICLKQRVQSFDLPRNHGSIVICYMSVSLKRFPYHMTFQACSQKRNEEKSNLLLTNRSDHYRKLHENLQCKVIFPQNHQEIALTFSTPQKKIALKWAANKKFQSCGISWQDIKVSFSMQFLVI